MKVSKNKKRDRLAFIDLYLPQYNNKTRKKLEDFKLLEKQYMLKEIELNSLKDTRMKLLDSIAEDISKDIKFCNDIDMRSFTDVLKIYNLDPNWELEFNEKRIKICIHDVLSTIYIKTASKTACYFAAKWKLNTAFLIRNSPQITSLKYNKIFVWFKFFQPLPFDCDNKFFKPLIDGIALSGIVKDDNCEFVKFGFEGIISHGKPRVEIFIFGDENIPDFIKEGLF